MSSTHQDITAEILRANDRFYQAFTRGDKAAMREVWAERAELTCLHPGAPPLHGQAAVLGAWQQILTGPSSVELRCYEPHVTLHGVMAIVTCYEGTVGQSPHLAATNVFVLEDARWRMVHHQAGPLAQARPMARAPRSGSSMN